MLKHYIFYIKRIENIKNTTYKNYLGNFQEFSRISKNPHLSRWKYF